MLFFLQKDLIFATNFNAISTFKMFSQLRIFDNSKTCILLFKLEIILVTRSPLKRDVLSLCFTLFRVSLYFPHLTLNKNRFFSP